MRAFAHKVKHMGPSRVRAGRPLACRSSGERRRVREPWDASRLHGGEHAGVGAPDAR